MIKVAALGIRFLLTGDDSNYTEVAEHHPIGQITAEQDRESLLQDE